MSAAITLCPKCTTRFRVTAEQLTTHNGLVRCGRCGEVFNANENFYNDEPSPQLSLPITTAAPESSVATEVHVNPDSNEATHLRNAESEVVQPATAASEFAIFANQIQVLDELVQEEPPRSKPKSYRWFWIFTLLSLFAIFIAQLLFFFRVEISVTMPGLKPALVRYCGLLNCNIPLPQQADLMSIESSDLEVDPSQASIVTLNALLRNRATHVQGYPNLELTLTDFQNKIVARRVFTPQDYLAIDEDEKVGLAGNREINVQLRLNTAELKPTGYKLFLFYPY